MKINLNILFALMLVFNFSCSNKKNQEELKNLKKTNTVDSILEMNVSIDNYDKSEQILFERISENEIWIYNCLNSGFTGETTLIKVNKDLKIKSVYYDYWTDVINEKSTEFEIINSKITFDKNPFNSKGEINITYELKLNEISYTSKKLVNSKIISSKIESREMNNENAEKYKMKYDFINSFKAYKKKYLDKKPELITNLGTFKRKLNSDFGINKMFISLSINNKGKVFKESIKFRASKELTIKQEGEINDLIIESLNYSPGFINTVPVSTELFIKI